ENGALSDLQEAFRRYHDLQCGYCTPGILMSAEQFLRERADPSEQEVREMLSGHTCPCTGSVGIAEATLETSRARAPAHGDGSAVPRAPRRAGNAGHRRCAGYDQ